MTAKKPVRTVAASPALSPLSAGTSSQHLTTIRPTADRIREFPSTRYYGSKRRLLPWIFEHIRSLQFTTALDAFGGTGSVSQLLRAMRKQVTYHDAFRFNTDTAAATLVGPPPVDRKELIEFLATCEPYTGTVATYFNGIFFLPEEDRWIDGYMAALLKAAPSSNVRSFLKHLLYQACLRKRPFNLFHRANLHLRTQRHIVRSFGNAATWERPFDEHILFCFDELHRLDQSQLTLAKIAPNGDVMALPNNFDLVYLDPPYIATQERLNRDGYWRRYHFLEGLSDYENWAAAIDLRSPVRMMAHPSHFSNWGSKATSKELLEALIKRHSSSIVVLSYVQQAYPDEQVLLSIFESVFKEVSMHLKLHSHALSCIKRREILIVGRPK